MFNPLKFISFLSSIHTVISPKYDRILTESLSNARIERLEIEAKLEYYQALKGMYDAKIERLEDHASIGSYVTPKMERDL